VFSILPGVSLLATALLILVLDLRLRNDRRRVASYAATLAFVGVLAAFALSLMYVGSDTRVLAVLTYDAFTAYIWRLILVSLALTVLLSASYIQHRTREPALFYAGLMFFGLGALLLSATTNTIMFLLAVDYLSLVAYMLTGFAHYDKRSTEAAIKYLIYGSAVSAMMAYALSWLYGVTRATDFAQTAQALAGQWAWSPTQAIEPRVLLPVLIFLLAGLAFKVGTAPFHQWVPDAFEGAPTPVTAALAVVPKIAGFAALVRFTMVMFPASGDLGQVWRWPLVGFLAITAMFVGNLSGLWQSNIKRFMAYSGIAQVGYGLLAVAVASEESLHALLVYLATYAFAEIGALAAIAVVSEREGLDEIMDYRGLYHRAPTLAVALILTLLSLFGMPGTAGFMGKLLLFSSVLDWDHAWVLIVAALNTVISMAYYWKVMRSVFMLSDQGLGDIQLPKASAVVLALAVGGVLILGVFPNFLLDWARPAVRVFFTAGR
jgi:NADH-quinone oxidoreductase subunit N